MVFHKNNTHKNVNDLETYKNAYFKCDRTKLTKSQDRMTRFANFATYAKPFMA